MPTALEVLYDASTSVHVGTTGKAIVVTVQDGNGSPANLSNATALTFTFSKPSGALLTVTPRFVTDGTDGQLTYTTVDGDISEAGLWHIQATVTTPSAVLHSDITSFSVLGNLI